MASCSDLVRDELQALYGISRYDQLHIEMGRHHPELFVPRVWTDDEVRAIFAKYDKLIAVPIKIEGFDYTKYLEGTV